jgi:hypothetical protein
MTIAAVTNASQYAWSDWYIGIMRSFLSGGAVAFATLGGGSAVGVAGKQLWIMIAVNFCLMGLYRMGEFLQLHGAPEKITVTETRESTIQPSGDGIKQTSTVTTTTEAPKSS